MFDFGWRRWLRTTFGTPARRPRRRHETRPRLEPLEPRWVPAFISVTNIIFPVTEGAAFTMEPVATFQTDTPGDTFSASIDWGDGSTTAGSVTVVGSAGTVYGAHTYAEDGSRPVTVSLTETGASPGTATAHSAANVAEAQLSVTGMGPISTTEGAPVTVTAATFTDPGSPDPASQFTASIAWGDGTTSAGSISGSAGSFTVTGTHTYADEISGGSYSVTVAEADTGFTSNPVGNTVTVAEGDSLSVPAAPAITATEGTAFSGSVATFIDDTNSNNDQTDFTATINWGDGTTSAGTVNQTNGAVFEVDGSHTYADEGSFAVTATLSDDAPGTATATATGTATVAEADSFQPGPATVIPTLTEGQEFTGVVAHFSDPGYPGNAATDFRATITWGDGTTSAGTVSGGAGSDLTVSGSHTYADEGLFSVGTVLADDAPSTVTFGAATGSFTVTEGDSFSVGAAPAITATEGTAFSGSVATFIDDTNNNNDQKDFTATINWGDGTTSAGTVNQTNGAVFEVDGSHTYADEGSFAVTATITDDAPGTATATATGTATVAEADSIPDLVAVPLSNVTEGTAFSGTVALFSDTFPNTASDLTATIAWGDGTTTAGTVVGVVGSAGNYAVTGSHTYADEGLRSLFVTVADDAPGTATASAPGASFRVAEADSLSATGVPIGVAAGATFSGPVATFTSSYTGNVAGGFSAVINWGDGTASAGVVTGSGGSFTVSGSHTYTDPGTFAASVAIADNAPGTATATAPATVSAPPTITTGQGPTSQQGPQQQQPTPTQLQELEMALDALLVTVGFLSNNPALLQLGLGAYFLETANQPDNVQSQMKQDFFNDGTTDTEVGLANQNGSA
jgi:hypothetical protein